MLLDNADEFTDPFFQRFQLRHASKPLQLNDEIAKDYLFPTFYDDVECAQAVFLCNFERAAELLPHPKMKPVGMFGNRALVAFSCYVYNKVLGVAPYNEIAMTIPIRVNPGVPVPVLPMLAGGLFSDFGYYVFSMPVTSLENQLRGMKIWGLPKVVHEIDIFHDKGDCVTVDKDEAGRPYFTLRVPMEGKPTKFDVKSNLYTRMGNDLWQSETNFKATFNVTKFTSLLWKRGVQPDREYLTIADTPAGEALRRLEIEPAPFQLRYAKHMTACFDLHNPQFRSPIIF